MLLAYPPEPVWMDRPPNELFSVKPLTLKFSVGMDSISCSSFQLSNKSDKHVCFRVKTTNPFQYSVQPKSGILLPRSEINVTVTRRALRKGSSDVLCGAAFLVQCVAVPPGTTLEKITPEMFNNEAGNHVEDCKLVAAFTYNYDKPVEETSEDQTAVSSEDQTAVSSEDHNADSSGSPDHEITSPQKLLKWGPRRYNGGWGPRRYNGGGGMSIQMSIHYALLIAVGFLLGYYVRS